MASISRRATLKRTACLERLRNTYPALLQVRARPDPSAVVLGQTPAGLPVLLPLRARMEHSHVIGTTGGGKSKFLEHCIRQDIAAGRGVLVIDPHGEHRDSLYRSLLGWLDEKGYLAKRTVHVIDPNAATHTIGFNPLARPDPETDLSVIAGVTLEAFQSAWGDEDTTMKPTIERLLNVTFTALADLNLTLVEAPLLLDRADRHGLRSHAIEHVSDPYTRDELRRLHELSLDDRRRHDFDMEVLGPLNRLARFVRPPAIRAMLGQRDHVLDMREALDQGHIILCNLSGGARVAERDAGLLGRLVTRSLFFHAKRRRRLERKFLVYLDECQKYLSGDLENILAEIRKFGVGAILSHQWLDQLREQSENMLAAVRNATNVKVVFRIKDQAEAEELAGSVIPLNLEIPVSVLIKPTVIGHRRIRLANESTSEQTATTRAISETRGESESYTVIHIESHGVAETKSKSRSELEGLSSTQGITHAEMSGVSEGGSAAEMLDPNQLGIFGGPMLVGMSQGTAHGSSGAISSASSAGIGHSVGTGRAIAEGRVESYSTSDGEAVSHGTSRATTIGTSESQGKGQSQGTAEALEPILAPLPSAVHGKDAVLYMAGQTLRNLRTGRAVLSYVGDGGMVSTFLTVPLISWAQLPSEAFDGLRERVLARSSAALPVALAAAAIARRQEDLLVLIPEVEDEPITFKTKAPRAAGRLRHTRPDAAKRSRSRPDADGG